MTWIKRQFANIGAAAAGETPAQKLARDLSDLVSQIDKDFVVRDYVVSAFVNFPQISEAGKAELFQMLNRCERAAKGRMQGLSIGGEPKAYSQLAKLFRLRMDFDIEPSEIAQAYNGLRK
jgi:hypothetical protein